MLALCVAFLFMIVGDGGQEGRVRAVRSAPRARPRT
jgi:hypothetical protein